MAEWETRKGDVWAFAFSHALCRVVCEVLLAAGAGLGNCFAGGCRKRQGFPVVVFLCVIGGFRVSVVEWL